MIDEEQRERLRIYARRKYCDPIERLRFLQQYLDTRLRIINFRDYQHILRGWDDWSATHVKRKRGERTKLDGAQMIEEIAVRLLKERARQLKLIATPIAAWETAREEIAEQFDISPATLEDWQRGVRRRYRKRHQF